MNKNMILSKRGQTGQTGNIEIQKSTPSSPLEVVKRSLNDEKLQQSPSLSDDAVEAVDQRDHASSLDAQIAAITTYCER